jgi:hypothetical protein
MMDNMLYIVPYTKEHGQIILSYQMNHKILEADRHFINVEGDAMNLEENNLAFTGIVNNKPIFAAGMKMIWGQVAEGWVIASSDMWKHPLGVAKAIKKDFARVAKEHNIKRVQTAIRKDFTKGQRFAEWLGLENEGLMKNLVLMEQINTDMRGYFNDSSNTLCSSRNFYNAIPTARCYW